LALTFKPADWQEYLTLRDQTPASTVVAGEGVVVQDVFGFYAVTPTRTSEEVTVIYKMRQVIANKRTGTGETINAGDKLYYYSSDEKVSATATGVKGTDYYECGVAKETVTAAATTVLMYFDGIDYNV
jgi:predicted RecA/RadA family phage recombinase